MAAARDAVPPEAADYARSLREWAAGEAAQVGAFERWLGGRIAEARVRMSYVEGKGRGLVATDGLRQGDLVLAIPRSEFLTLDSLWKSPIGFLLPFYGQRLGDNLMLCVYLMWERALGDRSELAPWMAMLPVDFTTVNYWSEDAMRLLGHPLRIEKARRHRKKLADAYATLRRRLLLRHPALFPDTSDDGPFGFPVFRWAQSILNTRCFNVSLPENSVLRKGGGTPGCGFPGELAALAEAQADPSSPPRRPPALRGMRSSVAHKGAVAELLAAAEAEAAAVGVRFPCPAPPAAGAAAAEAAPGAASAAAGADAASESASDDAPDSVTVSEWALMPLGDMFNHSPDGCDDYEYDPERGCMVFRVTRDHAAGEEVQIKYNSSGGWRQAKSYGMVDPEGRNAAFPVAIPPVPAAWTEGAPSDLDVLRRDALEEKNAQKQCNIGLQGPSPKLMRMLRIRYLAHPDLGPGGALPRLGRPVSTENEWNVWLYIARYCAAALATFTVRSAEDADWARRQAEGDAPAFGCEAVATAVRVADRTVLRKIRRHARQRAALLARSMLREATADLAEGAEEWDGDGRAAAAEDALARYRKSLDTAAQPLHYDVAVRGHAGAARRPSVR
eukprot:TRINITY_DN9412_c0_g1_i1.p1 TRINITY_DN9412_c0_g1~~TRINITY_DN9412_c0_g1_i1.p1  ORF type:complete len:639 (+),score=151.54 TRINITY_DN9412_c0_g1_i1:72-1919(+)